MPEERENLASNRQWRQNTVAGTGQDEYYTYDGLYQVSTLKRGTLTGNPPSGISGTPSWEENWNYDPTGNWRGSSTAYLTKVNGSTTLNQNRTHNVANEITDITESTGTAWPTPTQDAAGNLTVVPRPLSLGNSFDLKWDAWNRLTEVKNTGGSVIATYRYDGATRRVTKYDGTNTRHYYYSDQWQVLEERLNSSSSADRRFVWGLRSVDDLILRDDTSLRLYALSDAMGSVTAVVNTSGTVQQRYGYDGFGTPRYMDIDFDPASELFGWETLFDGYRYDRDSGLYQVRYRFLHPSLGRWIGRDPASELAFEMEFRPGQQPIMGTEIINLYAYVRNRPISDIDHNGLGVIAIPVVILLLLRALLLILLFLAAVYCLSRIRWPRIRSRLRQCRCTKRFTEEEPPADCPDRVYGWGTTRGSCQRDAKATAPPHCRKYYGHCDWTK
ncbi:MAG: hypothetical protein KIS67_20495 [Verrucomicrobiae bacterium]|nr:hypothetical protein [Verrucomicrobiae bacterium]